MFMRLFIVFDKSLNIPFRQGWGLWDTSEMVRRVQVGARDQDSVSAGSGGRPEVGYAVSSAASSVDGEDGASTSDAQRPAKRRSRCRCDPFGVFRTVYTGPEPSSRVEGDCCNHSPTSELPVARI